MFGATDTGTILIRGAQQVVTLRESQGARRGAALNELGIIRDGALLIRDGIIEDIGTSRRVENLQEARCAIEINAAGRVVMPGFVDCHTHLVFPPPGQTASDLANDAHKIHNRTAKRLARCTHSYLDSMARHGTTTLEAKTGCGPDNHAELKLLRAVAALKRDLVDVVPTLLMRVPSSSSDSTRSAESVADWYGREFLPKVRRRRLARFADLAWDSDRNWHRHFARLIQQAQGLGFACKIHADQERSADAIAMAMEHSVWSIDHLEHATRSDAWLMAGGNTMAALLPFLSFRSGSKGPPARALIEAGVGVALASDFNPEHNPNLNMQTAVALACQEMELTPAEAISAATINGAYALGCADRVGSLERTKEADLLVLNISDYREMAHHFGTNLVHLTMKRGEFIYQEGEVAKRFVGDLSLAW
jgi:imidazolonepropionase